MSLVTSTFELRLGLQFPLNGPAGAVSGGRNTGAHSHGQLQFRLRPSLACSVSNLGNGTALQWLWQPVTLCSWVRLHHKTFALFVVESTLATVWPQFCFLYISFLCTQFASDCIYGNTRARHLTLGWAAHELCSHGGPWCNVALIDSPRPIKVYMLFKCCVYAARY